MTQRSTLEPRPLRTPPPDPATAGILLRSLDTLQPGDHLCCLYESEAERQAVLTPYLVQGLRQHEKVVYIADGDSAALAFCGLHATDADVAGALASGQLSIQTNHTTYVCDGVFEPERMVQLLREETEQAVREGYTALRATGEMTWVLRGPPGAERLIEYEVLLNKFFPGSRCLGLCQYDRRRFAPEFLLDVLRAHPVVVLGTEVCENPFYIPPEELVRDGSAAACLQHWISGLLHNKRAAQRLRESRHDRELLLRELYHRVKNNLQVVSSLLRLQARTVTAPEALRALEESQRRIQAMAMLHNKLYESQELDQVNFGEYLTGLVQAVVRAHQAEGIRVDVEAPEEALPLDLGVAIPCGLVLNELLCNALTHAFPAERTGEVQVAVRRREGGCVELDVRDNGIGLPDHVDPRSSTSFGLQLVQTLVELQLKGDLELVRAAGTEFRIRFPLEGPPRPRERR